MATLHKFKLLATQCGVAPSPTRSPMSSPVVHFPRRSKSTLRMLLGRRWRDPAPRRRDTLKDLFISSTPAFQEEGEEAEGKKKKKKKKNENEKKGNNGREGESSWMTHKCQVWRMINKDEKGFAGSARPPAPGWIGFRHRSLLRRAWRPVLLGIPEVDDADDELMITTIE